MSRFRVGIIGCGRPRTSEGATGFGMAHMHAAGYEASPDCEIAAACDIDQANLDAFCREHAVPRGYTSVDEMLARETLDVVSVCLWPHLHAPTVIQVAEAGVKAIHCEKPMATTFGEARRMTEVCAAHDVVLTFNHMRRFAAPFRKAKELLDAGAVGRLERIEAYTVNLYDWGTHWFDMMFYLNDETPVDWVIGQIDPRGGHAIFGAMVEGQGLSWFRWRNGVAGLMVTGHSTGQAGSEPLRSIGCGVRVIGSDGVIEVGVQDGPALRIRNAESGGGWRDVETDGGIHGNDLHAAGVLDLVDALKTGREPELSARRALQATEVMFAAYESSRRRARVDLPLDIDDSPLVAMLDNADMTTWPARDVVANGITLHTHRTGGDRPPLVLCHGFTDNGLCWTRVARTLESDFDVIMYDTRGHGLSDAPEDGYGADDNADDLAGLIQALELDRPVVMGHSMGAATAAAFAARRPELVSRIILEDPPWSDDSWTQTSSEDQETFIAAQREQIARRKNQSREALIAQCHSENPAWHASELGPWAESKRQMSPHVVRRLLSGRPSWRSAAAAIPCPTLLITGDPALKSIVKPETAREVQDLNPNVRVVQIDGAGHCIHRDRFEPFVQLVKAYLIENDIH